MRLKTKNKMLAILDELRRKVRRAGARGERRLFTDIRQQIAMLHHVADEGMTREERAAFDDIFIGMEQALDALPQVPEAGVMQETAELLGGLVQYLMGKVQAARTKKLIVFLPYKAAMWDSLESIWMAADRDREHCQAMVIPIPYADRNPDGTAARWHYEIDQFPKYVPVVHCNTVDLAALHPDVIFIHNPYDDHNIVTSVDMKYYSSRLKHYTEDLVYVPYFVSGETVQEHFCKVPGVINADHVIVQDENIKEQYENYYPGGHPPKGKFLALGSPKFDKVRSAKREDYHLPPDWQRIVEGKKAVLYNTTLTAMLEHTDVFCEKIRDVFQTFQGRDDVALWWRPHPLLAATFESMHPERYGEYQQLVKDYQAAGWGIYDDTADLDRAIACTDAYYGDGSSLVPLYEATGKAILLQSYEDLEKQKEAEAQPEAAQDAT